MKAARLWIVLAGAILLGSSLGATAARADGLPVLGVDVGATGVVTPSGQARYVTIPAGADTVVARVDRDPGSAPCAEPRSGQLPGAPALRLSLAARHCPHPRSARHRGRLAVSDPSRPLR